MGSPARATIPSCSPRPSRKSVEATASRPLSGRGSGDALTATNNPPLYYAVEAVPYKLAGASLLSKLSAMRLVSALMGAVTVMLVYLFLTELLPGRPWAWTSGALLVAFQPLFGFMSGGVNNDDLLYLASAGVLWAIARAFRRGLSPGSGALMGAFLAVGLLAKLTMLAFVPAVALALVLLTASAWEGDRARALRGAAWAVAAVAVPVVVFIALDRLVWHRASLPPAVSSVQGTAGRAFSRREELSHIWQLFLPPLWMQHQFGYSPLWETWFKGFFGTFGWLDFTFPEWVFDFARIVAAAVCVLAIAELVRGRRALRRRLGELAVYATVVGRADAWRSASSPTVNWSSAAGDLSRRAICCRCWGCMRRSPRWRFASGGRRWGPAIGAALVVLAFGHEVFAQGLAIARYYT